jgi:GT2 family glycosyltransferase
MSLLIKREVLEKLKYCFDPSFLAYFEEIDLCWRVKLLGYKVMYVPTSRVLHRGSFTFEKIQNETALFNYKNKILSFKKNLRFPLKQIILILVLTRMLFPVLMGVVKGHVKNSIISISDYIFDKPILDVDLKKVSLKMQLSTLSLPILSRYSQHIRLMKKAKEIRNEIMNSR